jgi:hypothetical protein
MILHMVCPLDGRVQDSTSRDSAGPRRGRLSRSAATLLAAVCALGAAAGCGGSNPSLRTGSIQRAAARSILLQHGLHAKVNCPTSVPRRTGYVFRCVAALEVGTYPLLVTETSDNGHVRYENSSPLVTLKIADVERAITGLLARDAPGTAIAATCPREVIQRAGIRFTCTASSGSQLRRFRVTEVNGSGRVRFTEAG